MSNKTPFFLLDSFTATPYHGNPAGVFFDADGSLTAEQMRRLAGAVHRESAFVAPGHDGSNFRLRYFTGVTEVPFCGHATVAAITALFQEGRLSESLPQKLVIDTPVGKLFIGVTAGNTPELPQITLFQNAPQFGIPLTETEITEVATALNCDAETIAETKLPVQTVSTGTPWLLVPVRSRFAVDNAPADQNAIRQLSERHKTFGIYLFTVEPHGNDVLSVWSRCFAPIAGLPEDPVTGSASGALGGYLVTHGVASVSTDDRPAEIIARQGFGGGRGGTAFISVVRTEAGLQPRVRGTAVRIAAGHIHPGD
jgi:trans-2,3-dihydro-3-hydroxyanthranilate isomerase